MMAMITAKIVHETPKAVLALVGGGEANDGSYLRKTRKVWLPKSQIKVEPSAAKEAWTLISLPMWLVDKKGL